jgi:hypothetical protein
VNLIGHVAVALAPGQPEPPVQFLVGCMLPDLAAIARVRMARPEGTLGRGVEFHHLSDAAFHESEWFRVMNGRLRDALLDVGVASGAARACSHAGAEMLLDGALVADERVETCAQLTLDTVDDDAEVLATLAPEPARSLLAERLRLIGSSLEPRRYREPRFVAERLYRMTAGRRRIEVRAADVDTVTAVLESFAPAIAAAAPGVLADVRQAVPSHHLPG